MDISPAIIEELSVYFPNEVLVVMVKKDPLGETIIPVAMSYPPEEKGKIITLVDPTQLPRICVTFELEFDFLRGNIVLMKATKEQITSSLNTASDEINKQCVYFVDFSGKITEQNIQ